MFLLTVDGFISEVLHAVFSCNVELCSEYDFDVNLFPGGSFLFLFYIFDTHSWGGSTKKL